MRAIIGFLAWWALAAAAWAQSAPPAAVFGRLPAVVDAAISPDGSKIAVAGNRDGVSMVLILDANEAFKPIRVMRTDKPEERVRRVDWMGNRFAAAVIARTFRENEVTAYGWERRGPQQFFDYERVAVVDLQTGAMRMMMTGEDASWAVSRLGELVTPIAGEPEHGRMIAPLAPGAGAQVGAYRVNVRTGNGVVEERFGNDTWEVLFDARGRAMVRSQSDRAANTWRLLARVDEDWRAIAAGVSPTGAPPRLLGLFPDGRIASLDEAGPARVRRLVAFDPASGEKTAMLERAPFDIRGTILDPESRAVVGAEWQDDLAVRQHFFDPALAAAAEALQAAVGEAFVRITSWSADRTRLVAAIEDGRAATYVLFDRRTNTLSRWGDTYPELPAAQIGATSAIRFRARDGVRVPGYVTLPPGVETARNLPAVVLAHGGPAARDTAEFNWWVQHLASRGYVVLQPNFRGSTGYGRDWEEAGHGEWGGLMQTDIEDMVLALGRSGMIDPARVCIVGASYGGYAALAGATLTPDRYRCAASVHGVADLLGMLDYDMRSRGADSPSADYWRLSIGRLREDRARIAAVSPAEHAAAVKAPILLVHGTRDWVVPIDQARTMRARLEAAGKSAALVELDGDDHFLSSAETRTRMLEVLEQFLARHNPVTP